MAEFLCLTRVLFFYSLYTFSSYEDGPPGYWFDTAR
jgi:hypothetical protein